MSFSFKMTGDWKKFANLLDKKQFQPRLEANLAAATKLNSLIAAKEMRRRIKGRGYTANSALTVLLKGSSTPLIDDADLFAAITFVMVDSKTSLVGVLRQTKTADGRSMANLAELLHNGGVIRVTQAMRDMFDILAEVAQGKREVSTLDGRAAEIAAMLGARISQIKPFKPSTTSIRIKARPFITSVMKDPMMVKKFAKNWQNAVVKTFEQYNEEQPPVPGAPSNARKSKGGSAASAPTSTKQKGKRTRNYSAAARKGWATRRSKAQKQ